MSLFNTAIEQQISEVGFTLLFRELQSSAPSIFPSVWDFYLSVNVFLYTVFLFNSGFKREYDSFEISGEKVPTTLIFYEYFALKNRKLRVKPILDKLIIKNEEEKLSLVRTDLHRKIKT